MKKIIIIILALFFSVSLYAAETLEKTVSFSKKGSAPGEIKGVADIEASKGFVYVLDSGNYRVSVFRDDGTFFMSFGSFGAGKGEFNSPSRIAIDGTGCIYVLDYYSVDHDKSRAQSSAVNSQYYYPRIQKFSPDGKFLLSYGRAGAKNGEFLCTPSDIAVDKNNRLIVLDSCNSRVQVFNASGKFVTTYGSYGSCETCLDGASRIDVDIDNNVLVLDVNNSRFLKFSPEGKPLPMPLLMGNEENQIFSQYYFKCLEDGTIAVLHSYGFRPGYIYQGTADKYYITVKFKYFDKSGSFIKYTEAVSSQKFAGPPYNSQLIIRSLLNFDAKGDVFFLETRNGTIEKYAVKNIFIDLDRVNKSVYAEASARGNTYLFDNDVTDPEYQKSETIGGSGNLGMNISYPLDDRSSINFEISGGYLKENSDSGTYGIPTPATGVFMREYFSSSVYAAYSRTYDLNENKGFNTNLRFALYSDQQWLTGEPSIWERYIRYPQWNIRGGAGIDITPFINAGISGSYDYYHYENGDYLYERPSWDVTSRVTVKF